MAVLRYAGGIKDCEKCGRPQPHTKRGQCIVCGGKQRRAKRMAKRVTVGSPLVRATEILTIADDLFSVWTRAKSDVCVVCRLPFHPADMQAMHGISRGARIIRFEPDNVFPGCPGCHRRHTPPRTAWEDWRLEYLGRARFDRIAFLDKAGGKLGVSGYQLVILETRQRIAQLPDNMRKVWALEREAAIMERLTALGRRMGA